MIGALVLHELRLAWRQASDAVTAIAFFLLAATLFPLGVGPEPDLLGRMAPGVVWATALLAALLTADRLFQADWEDGTLEQLVLQPVPLSLIVLAKAGVHWLTTGLPLALIAGPLALMLRMDPEGLIVLVASLLLGTPCLSLFGGLGAALALGARRAGPLVPLIVLPLLLPVLIFGAGAVEAALTGLGARTHLLILGALFAGALALVPPATALALRQALE